jgi:hypothetical protein
LGLNGSLSGWHFFVVMIRVFMNSSFAAMSVGVTTV